MKTQLTNIYNTLPGINSLQSLFNPKSGIIHLLNLKWVEQILSFEFSRRNIARYILPLLKQGFKEATGAEVDIAVLLLLFIAYLASVKNALVHNTLVRKMKIPAKTGYQLSQAA